MSSLISNGRPDSASNLQCPPTFSSPPSGAPDCIFLSSFSLCPYSPEGGARSSAKDGLQHLAGLLAAGSHWVSRLQKPGDLVFWRGRILCCPPRLWLLVSAEFEAEHCLGMLWPPSTAKGHSKCACLSPWPCITGYLTSLFPVNFTGIQTSLFIGGLSGLFSNIIIL